MKLFKRFLGVVTFICMFVIGFLTVNAEEAAQTIRIEKGAQWYVGTYNNVGWDAYVKYSYDANGNKRYAFCMESGEVLDFGNLNIQSNWKNAKVDAIVSRAMELGLGTGHNSYGVNDIEFYGITQSAIWKAVNGEKSNGYSERYQQWIKGTNKNDNNNGKDFSNLFDELWNSEILSYSVDITGNKTMKLEDNFLISDSLNVKAVNVPSDATFTITLSNINGGKNGSAGIATNSSNWNHKQTVKNGDTLQVRMPIVEGHSDYSVQLDITSSFNAGYKVYYYPSNNGQDIGVAIPTTSTVSGNAKITGTYVPKKIKLESTLTISKKDLSTDDSVQGAKMSIYRIVDGKREINPCYVWISTKEDYVINNITPGKYVLIETAPAPDYKEGMFIGNEKMSEYEFLIDEEQQLKINVYNELKAKRVDVPNTGMNITSVYFTGGFISLIGVGIVIFTKKKAI